MSRGKSIRSKHVKCISENPISIRHEQAYHTAICCQGKRSGLTADHLCGWKKACLIESEKTTGAFADQRSLSLVDPEQHMSGNSPHVSLLCQCTCLRLIRLPFEPHGMKDTHPDVGESTDGDRMAFPFFALALV